MSDIISKELANQEIIDYMTKFSNARDALSSITDPDSKNYYNAEEISFIFERNVIEALWQLNPTANGLRVYYGSHPDGTPTLVLVSCLISLDSENKVSGAKNLLYSDGNAGAEWPRGKSNMCLNKTIASFNISDDNF